MALDKVDIQRVEWLKTMVDRIGIRFPVADIAAKTGFDQGNVSSYLKGKKPISDNFITRFRQAYGVEGPGSEEGDPTTKEILKVLAEAFKSQTEILKSIENKMAQQADQLAIKEKVQVTETRTAEITSNLDQVQRDVTTLLERQEAAIDEFRDRFSVLKEQKTGPSKGARRKHGQNDGI